MKVTTTFFNLLMMDSIIQTSLGFTVQQHQISYPFKFKTADISSGWILRQGLSNNGRIPIERKSIRKGNAGSIDYIRKGNDGSISGSRLFAKTVIEPSSDELILRTAQGLRKSSWLSWWTQVILTVVSSVTLLFAKSVIKNSSDQLKFGSTGGFVLAGSGIILSSTSIIWTFGFRRLGRRLVRRNLSRISSANIIRRAVKVGLFINLAGMFITILGAEQIVGTLAAKVLTMQSAFGQTAGSVSSYGPSLQPLDILIVQANTNTLFSHFVSLACTLYLNRWVDRLDPPSQED